MTYYKKKEWPKWDDFIRENKPGVAIINCHQSVQPARHILGLITVLKFDYIVERIDLHQIKTEARIEDAIHSRDCFLIGRKNIKPKILVFEKVEHINPKSALLTYMKEKVISIYGKTMFVILVVDKEAVPWNFWIGFLDKLPIPKFKMFDPNWEEKKNALQTLEPFSIMYKPESGLQIREKMNEVTKKITTQQEIRTFKENVLAFGQIYQPDRQQRDACDIFQAIAFLRNKCRITSLKDWKQVENVLKQHSDSSSGTSSTDKDIIRKLVNLNPPEMNMGITIISHALKSKWYGEFSELDSLGYDGSALAPVTIGLTSWSERFKVFQYSLTEDLMEEDNKSGQFRQTKMKSDFNSFGSSQNFLSCNQYFSNQFTPFEIFDSISLMQNVDFMFDYYSKIINDGKDIDILMKLLRTQFGILLDIGARVPRLHRPELIEEAEEKRKQEQKKEEEEDALKLRETQLVKKKRVRKQQTLILSSDAQEEIHDEIPKKKPRKKKYQMEDDDDVSN